VAVDVAVPPADGVTLLGENETWTPPIRPLAVRLTSELKVPMDVRVAVSVAELPEPTVRVGELSVSEKSAPDVTVSVNVVVWVIGPLVPLRVIVAGPNVASDATLIVNVAEAVLPAGMLTGFVENVENVTPEGAEPVTESVTDPE
jgi:hypothetical protein